eukprot:TRINITY_DN56554_c0_g1_i1.p1 TRINITY_DN56554_c0_g1~~TRINITY_DN56554_c0_g1_i1.p1  ORF type:complete len:158 (-),score=28.98 TRINITY_DN56554_c0_g1_i1:18-458(-)
MSTIKLKSKDGREFEVAKSVATMSQTITNLIDSGFGGDVAIPITEVNSATLERVLNYCKYRKDNPYTPEQLKDERSLDLDPWDEVFIELEQPVLFDLILAANFLDIKPLLDLACKKVAKMIKAAKSPEEIRETFNIITDEPCMYRG